MTQNMILATPVQPIPADPHQTGGDEPAVRPEDRKPVIERPLLPALLRGWRQRCPNCGGGPMMSAYLKVRHSCAACGEELHHHRADDLPAWATILIVGHFLVGGLLTVETSFHPPLWVHWAIWPAATLGATLWLLPHMKGMVVAFQWSKRMHGFDDTTRG